MAKRFLRLDLSADARDFQSVAVEPGLPLLDKSNANYRVLQRWLGRLIAEPEWHADSVDLFVCDDQKARLNDVRCEPATMEDFTRYRELRQDFEELARRLQQVKPEPREAKVHQAIVRHFQKLSSESGAAPRACYLFKYREGNVWRLVWAWGYQRKDLAPASPTICTNPNCSLLFVRLSEGSRTCPACEKGPLAAPPPAGKKRWLVAALLLLALAAGVAGYFLGSGGAPPLPPPAPRGLVARPEEWTGPVGGQLQYAVLDRTADGSELDVTDRATAVVDDPRVLRLDKFGSTAQAIASGKTPIHFHLGAKVAHATVEVQPPRNPSRITIEPGTLSLGEGTTAQLRVLGEFEGGLQVDLTNKAEWTVASPGNVCCYQGRLEGISSGDSAITAQYRATPADPYLSGTAKVTVTEEEYQSLELKIQPNAFDEGKAAKIEASVTARSGQKHSVSHSSLLNLEVKPPQLAKAENGYLLAQHSGSGKLTASFGDLQASQDFQVKEPETVVFYVKPNPLQLIEQGTAELQVVTSSAAPIRVVSSDPGVVEVLSGLRIAGRKAGKAEVAVSQGAFQEKVQVEVLPDAVQSIRFVPERVSVPVDGSATLRLVGLGGQGQEVELTPDGIVWEQLPRSEFAHLDLTTLEVRGRQPTGASPQKVLARWGELRAEADVEVVSRPLQVELGPAGPVRLPAGHRVRLQAWARYGGDRRVELQPGQLAWKVAPPHLDGLSLDRSLAAVRATKPGLGPLTVRASYQGSDSNAVEILSVEPRSDLQLRPDRSLVLAGDTGQLLLSCAERDATEVSLENVQFECSDSSVLAVDKRTGAYRAVAPGSVTVRACRRDDPASTETQLLAEAVIPVLPDDQGTLALRPSDVTLIPGGRRQLRLFRVAGQQEEEIAALADAGQVQLEFAQPHAVQWQAPWLVGTSLAEPFPVTAHYRGKTAQATVRVVEAPAADKSALRIVPPTASLAPGQTLAPRVEQQLPGDGENWGEVQPAAVTWTVPDTVYWTPPSSGLPPQLTLRESAQGSVEIPAEYEELKAKLAINVVAPDPTPPPLETVRIVRDPPGEQVEVGRRQRYTVMVGEGPDRRPAEGVTWLPPFENDWVRWDPPTLTALKPGHEQRLEARLGDQTLPFATRTVLPPRDPQVNIQQEIVLSPEVLRLGVGETKRLGTDVTVRTTGGTDLSDQLRVARPVPAIVRSDDRQRSVEGVVPGRDRLILTTRESRIPLDVIVEAGPLRPPTGKVEIEPAGGTLAQGETTDLRVILVVDGTGQRIDRTGSARIQSDHPEIAAVAGPRLTGVAQGTATITATLPGAAQPATASFTVTPWQPTGLIVSPDRLQLAVGEEGSVRVFGTESGERRDVTNHPDLKWDLGGENQAAVEDRGGGVFRGVSPGNAILNLRLDTLSAAPVPIQVSPQPPLTGLVIEPSEVTIEVGGRTTCLVSGRRGDRTTPLSADDGVQLRVTDTSVAAVESDLTVRGTSPGSTEVTAFLGPHRAAARLNVVRPEGPPPPPLPWDGLRFMPDLLALQLGIPGASVRVVKVNAEGEVEDVDHRAEIVVADKEIVDVNWTASGPVFVAKKVGHTEATATQGAGPNKLETLQPLQIMVIDPAKLARLEVRPDPVHLSVGETSEFRRVQLISENGATPVDVGYQVVSRNPSIVAVDGGKALRGVAGGQAVVSVIPVLPNDTYPNLDTDVSVEVAAPPPSGAATLELTGPSRTTAPAEVNYRAELVDGSGRQDVTHTGAELVIDRDQAALAEERPGCALQAKAPGTVNVRARYQDLVSNLVPLQIDPPDTVFERLELEIDRKPFTVSESRPYKVWGHPPGGGPRQDLTQGVTSDPTAVAAGKAPVVVHRVVEPAADADIVAHTPPTLIARSPGRFQLRAAYGPQLQSELIDLEIIQDDGEFDLRVVPPELKINVGEHTPPLAAIARPRLGQGGRRVEAQWRSLDDAVLKQDPENPARFMGLKVGQTELEAESGGQKAKIRVTVGDDPFHAVTVEEEPDWKGERFAPFVNIESSGQQDTGREYRIYPVGDPNAGQWKAVAAGSGGKIRLQGPFLSQGPAGTVYHLEIEARDRAQKIEGKYPLTFQVKPPTIER